MFSREQIKFDINKCAACDNLSGFLEGAGSGRMYTPTEEIREGGRGIAYRKLITENGVYPAVWVEDKFVKDYKDCVFIGLGGKNPLCAVDNYGDVIAAIMPFDMDKVLKRLEE